jgi:hypothetical protein
MAIVLSGCFITVCTHLLKLVLQRKRVRIAEFVFQPTEDCRTMSVLIDEDNVIKIKEPEIIIANM